MSVTIILKGRKKNTEGRPAWHDRPVFDAAIRSIIKAKGEAYGKQAIWFNLAERIENAAEKLQYGEKGEALANDPTRFYLLLPDIPVNLSPAQARHLWKELLELKGENFFDAVQCQRCGAGIQPSIDAALLNIMLRDFAGQLGEKFPQEDDEIEETAKG